ncbi:MAG: PVC-type heme-binding CxxCH protein, partial [Planctomycetota bacterium]
MFLTLLLLLSPAASLPPQDIDERFVVPDGMKVELWAESPLMFNPTAMAFDEQGRLWVTEAVNYRQWNGRNPGKHFDEGDRVVVLEDTDGDGRADKSTVFAQDSGLTAPLGIHVDGDRVLVSCSPHLYEYRDLDGDLVADTRSTLSTGWGGPDHDHGLHSFLAMPDGDLLWAAGNAGPHLVTDADGFRLRSGSVYRGGGQFAADNHPGLVSDDGRVWVGGLIGRMRPDGGGLRVLAHNFRNNYEAAI